MERSIPIPTTGPSSAPAARRGRVLRSFGTALLLGLCAQVQAGPIAVPNGDFSNPANFGTVGGGLIGGSGSAPIGTGPWNGAWYGVAGLLAPPSLTIEQGKASVGGLAGVNVLGLVNNGGSFQQALATPWQANRHYTLSADVTPSGLLDLGLLHSGNVGLALAAGSGRVASTATSSSVTLDLLGGSTYRLKLEYDTGPTVSGNIGIHLFTEPSGLLSASLLSSIAFSNVTLSSHMLNQVPTSLVAVDASPRSATVGAPVTPPLAIQVLDAEGDPIEGVTVTFTVPSSGPSATVAPNPATTDESGVAQVTTTANTIAGSYQIVANVSGVATPLVFDMTNLPGPAAGFGGVTGNAQSGAVGGPFTSPVGLQVVDAYGNPVPGVPVTYTAPSSGASSGFPTANTITVPTGPDGRADVTPVANTIAGSYQIVATAPGVDPIAFDMTNLPGPAAGFGNVTGNAQSGVVADPFASPVGLQVVDAYGNPVPGVPVTYTAPPSGASAGFPTDHAVTVQTGPDGRADVTPVANTIAGSYQIVATTPGVSTPQVFDMTNRAGPAAMVGPASGSGQGAVVLTPFAQPLTAFVGDAYGNPVSGASVTFEAPASGPSATGVGTVSTGSDGIASITPTANGIAGPYTITARTSGVTNPATFALTNLLDPSIVPNGPGEPTQNAGIGSVFSCQLLVQVTNGAQPQSGLEVEFVAPAAGPSAILSHEADSGTTLRVATDDQGYAWVEATANDVVGSYTVTAQLLYSTAAPIEFQLRNLDADDPIFRYGFDGSCRPAGTLKVDLGEQAARH